MNRFLLFCSTLVFGLIFSGKTDPNVMAICVAAMLIGTFFGGNGGDK